MLDSETKRRIDTARDILVGRVPDPKSQVEQITIALIYKFMDDMDARAEEMGGKRTFFTGDFSRYGWAKIMYPGIGGHETSNLYSEGIERMQENPSIPTLFRNIYKNARLPFRDPETLKMFLKVIDDFRYDHSERLGDAFEYLLSVLGSQGDAGQFRTPRHIIDFMVAVLDPKKTETILDPACGTAGFLISAYKHILSVNRDASGNSTLTPDEMGKLVSNISGYDISPDMVRLSLVNLYLHGFPSPNIHEYDTLSDQTRWNEYADVILANPPFMSPKGGIVPHKRFSVQSKRSEVLFVDYMAEHLMPNGRAGIIVPEGIIFTSQTAYKQLRKMLVEEYLVAVVSLPAGVFSPYSGVKTSILILDKSLAKRATTIGFFKIEKDGYGLGAQRRPLCNDNGDKPELCPIHSDIPKAVSEISKYIRQLRSGDSKDEFLSSNGLIVPKETIELNGDYNLGVERYREPLQNSFLFPVVPLGQICELIGGGTPSKQNDSYWTNGCLKWISSKHIAERGLITDFELISKEAVEESSTRVAPKGSTILITRVSVGKYAFADDDYAINQDLTALVSRDNHILAPEFLQIVAPYLANLVEQSAEGIGVRGVTRSFLAELQIPLPPLEVQKEIVAEIEGYQKVIDGARAVVDNYRPHIPIDPKWPMVSIGEACDIYNGSTPSRSEPSYWEDGSVPWFTVEDIRKNGRIIRNTTQFVTQKALAETSLKLLPINSVLLCCTASVGEFAYTEIELTTNQQFNGLVVKKEFAPRMSPLFLFHLSIQFKDELIRLSGKTSFNFVSGSTLKTITFPLPPITEQQAIVAEIEAEQALVNANRELITRMQAKIQAVLARIWGEQDRSVDQPIDISAISK